MTEKPYPELDKKWQMGPKRNRWPTDDLKSLFGYVFGRELFPIWYSMLLGAGVFYGGNLGKGTLICSIGLLFWSISDGFRRVDKKIFDLEQKLSSSAPKKPKD